MAMNGAALKATAKATIFAKLQTLFEADIPADLDPASRQKIVAAWENLADAVSDSMIDIINHIVTNAVVSTSLASPSVSVVSVSGVTAGSVASGPGTGALDNIAATGTIS